MDLCELEKELLALVESFSQETEKQWYDGSFLRQLSDLSCRIKEAYPQIAAALKVLYGECSHKSTKTTVLVLTLLAEKVRAATTLNTLENAIGYIRHVNAPGLQSHPQIQHCYGLIAENRPPL